MFQAWLPTGKALSRFYSTETAGCEKATKPLHAQLLSRIAVHLQLLAVLQGEGVQKRQSHARRMVWAASHLQQGWQLAAHVAESQRQLQGQPAAENNGHSVWGTARKGLLTRE